MHGITYTDQEIPRSSMDKILFVDWHKFPHYRSLKNLNDLDAGHHGVSESGQNVRKNIALHLKAGSSSTKSRRGRKPGRPKKDERTKPTESQGGDEEEEVQLPPMKGPPEPLHRNSALMWDHKVNLVGRRHMDPHIHCCEHCKIPILIYGRVIPCKHVFCLDCAKKAEKTCMRCGDPVQRIEQAALGTVFICTHGGAKHGVSGCRRTYLSARDLQAHVQYRHAKDEAARAAAAGSNRGATSANPSQPRSDFVTSQALAAVSMLSPGVQQTLLPVGQGYAATGEGVHVLPQSFSAPPPSVSASHPHVYTQPQQGTGGTIEGYHAMSIVNQAAAAAMGHQNLISIPMQQEQLAAQAGYDARVPPPQIGSAAGYGTAQQVGGAGRGYPPTVSFPSSMPPPHHSAPPPGMVHLPPPNAAAGQIATSHVVGIPGHGGPAVVTSGLAAPRTTGPPPRFPPQNQSFSQPPSGHWQGQGPPPMSHRPRTSSGPPPRY